MSKRSRSASVAPQEDLVARWIAVDRSHFTGAPLPHRSHGAAVLNEDGE